MRSVVRPLQRRRLMPPSTSTTLALASERTLPPIISSAAAPGHSVRGALAASWGVAGQVALVAVPAALLLRTATRGLAGADLGPAHWALAAATLLLLGYFQAYRGFQRGYAPFVAARAAHLARHPTAWHAIAAPLHVCGLIAATRRRRARTAALFAIMPLLALAVGRLPEPYRAIVDLGVAFGLTWGAVALAAFGVRAALGRPPAVALDLPLSSR